MDEHQHRVLAHVVIDPIAWYDHARGALGEQEAKNALAAKVQKWSDAYQAAVDKFGTAYKTRAERGD